MPYVIAYDLGTGGIKASLHLDDGMTLAKAFSEYPTLYPHARWHEQHPRDWWTAVGISTAKLLGDSGVDARDVRAVALSGQSLVTVPLDRNGNLLLESVPIWSDTRASAEAEELFSRVSYEDWYGATGNGDPAETYSVMKLMWLKKHQPQVWAKTVVVLGSKDYINFKLTGNAATDYSYASGCGMFDLKELRYAKRYIAAAGLERGILPDVMDSHAIVGTVTKQAAAECGLAEGTLVACGGVDNACMALGARGVGEGRVYMSLGSSSWIAVTSQRPLLHAMTRPFIFAHVERGYYTSGVSIFAAGSAYRWARNELCHDWVGEGAYEAMNDLAAGSAVGANGVLFNPSLAGGSTQNASPDLRGSFVGISLATTRGDLLRAVLEGVALDLATSCLGVLQERVRLEDTLLVCGGGARSPLWLQILADVFAMNVCKTNIDQDAASLGAASIAARAAGFWKDYARVDDLRVVEHVYVPDPASRARYTALVGVYTTWTRGLAEVGKRMREGGLS